MYIESEIYGCDIDGNRGTLISYVTVEGCGDEYEKGVIMNEFEYRGEAIYGKIVINTVGYAGCFFDDVEFDTSEYFTKEEIEELNRKFEEE